MIPRNIPNVITLLRVVLIPPIVWCLLNGAYWQGLVLFVMSGLTDAADGFLARHYGWTSRFGAIIDPLADKCLLILTFSTLTYLQRIPIWLCSVVIARDVLIVCCAMGYHFFIKEYDFEPTRISKLNTTLQLFYVFLLVLNLAGVWLPHHWITIVMYSVLATTTISFIDYTWVWSSRGLLVLRDRK